MGGGKNTTKNIFYYFCRHKDMKYIDSEGTDFSITKREVLSN